MEPFPYPESRIESKVMKFGVNLLGLASISAGILDLIWGDFDPGHQPIQALGVNIPARAMFAYLAGIWMIVAGAALLWRRTARQGSWALAIIYFIFGLFSVPRFYTMPHKYGFHITLVLGVMGEMLQQFIVVAGCMVFHSYFEPAASRWSANLRLIARWIFGLSGILFGMAHFVNAKGIVHMIPRWMPFSTYFWIEISGIGFSLAGLAILSGILNVLAAHLLALMLLVFEIILLPLIFGYPHLHQAFGASAYNLAVAGSVCIFAASIESSKRPKENAEAPFAQAS